MQFWVYIMQSSTSLLPNVPIFNEPDVVTELLSNEKLLTPEVMKVEYERLCVFKSQHNILISMCERENVQEMYLVYPNNHVGYIVISYEKAGLDACEKRMSELVGSIAH
jgi:hypothetical protein